MDPELPSHTELEAPPYSAVGSSANAQTRSLHSISLRDSKGFEWLTLTGDVISGQVDFDVLKSESLKGLSVKITAGTTLVGQEEQCFLSEETDLWTPAMTLPDGTKPSKFTKGTYTWPFSFTLPAEVEVQDQKTKKKFPLPTSFSERASTAYLDYKLIVTVKRGFLKVNSTLMTSFAFVPVTRPEPPSAMLQKAYKENLALVGPEGDPDGWHALPPLTIEGRLFDSRTTEVTLTLAVAKPLTYGRGTVIPLWLTLTGNDEQAMDLLSTPMAIKLLLVRSLATNDTEHRTDNCFFENVARAVLWAPEDYRGQGQRILQGEVEVKGSLKPSTLFPRFTINYSLDLQPFEVPGFVPLAPKNSPLLSQKVTVATFPALGIPIRSRAPPEYIQEQSADYNKSVGLLENGNQRFYHHGGAGGF